MFEPRRSEARLLPGLVKLLSTLDPSQDSTALSTDGSVLKGLWLDRGGTVTTDSSPPSWCSCRSPTPCPITQDFGLDTETDKETRMCLKQRFGDVKDAFAAPRTFSLLLDLQGDRLARLLQQTDGFTQRLPLQAAAVDG